MGKEFKIEFTEDNLQRFLTEYYKTHRKGKKVIIDSPMARSMNKILIITNRIVQNNHKKYRGEYTKFVIKELGLERLGISSTDLFIHFVFPSKARHDLDNYIAGIKEYMDSFTEMGTIVDDDYSHIKSITSSASYEKGVTKMIFTFKNCEFNLEEMEIALEKERIKKEKREETMKANKLKKKTKSKKK